MTSATEAVMSLKRRITTVLAARESLRWIAAWCVVWGVAGLVARFAFHVAPGNIAIGAAALPVVILAAILRARARRPADRQLVALIDARTRSGGLVMAAYETDLGAWQTGTASAPTVQWAARRETTLAILSAAFAVAVVLVPARKSEARQPLAIGRDVERLQDRVEVLREEKIIEDAQAEVMAQTLEDLRREATGEDATKAWEALDQIDEATAQAAREAADAAVQKGQQLTRLEAMAFALGSNAVDPSKLAEGMRELASELNDAQQSEALSKAGASDPKSVEAAARAGKEALRNMLGKLRDRGLIDPKTLRQFEKAAEFANRDDLGRFLKQHGSETKLSNAVGQFCFGNPGVDRGRGDAPMFFGEKAPEDGQFAEKTLPPAAAAALSQSQLVAITAAAPDEGNTQRSNGGALTAAQPGAGSAYTAEVLPRHRGTVTRFFERKK